MGKLAGGWKIHDLRERAKNNTDNLGIVPEEEIKEVKKRIEEGIGKEEVSRRLRAGEEES